MTGWEDAFKSKGEKEAPPAHEEEVVTRRSTRAYEEPERAPREEKQPPKESKAYEVTEPPVTPTEPKRALRDEKPRPKKKRYAYPPILQRIHNNLDEIWVNILLKGGKKPDTLLMCGATRGEGCLFTSFYLSLFLALGHGMRVLYVDTNVNAFASNPYLPVSPDHPGLASYFLENKALSSLILGTEYDTFFVLPSGSGKVENKRHNVIIEKEDLENLTGFCRDNFDVTIFAGQPITMRPVMIEFAKAVDQLVLICRYGLSRREVSKMAIEKLAENDIAPVGIILNERQYPVPMWVYKILK
ncbi:MAG: hypothetical protein ABIG67_06525 [Pseudomonadota bacterium]